MKGKVKEMKHDLAYQVKKMGAFTHTNFTPSEVNGCMCPYKIPGK